MASYNLFNYSYRPAKSIERKLFIELLKEIYGVSSLNDCIYIGMGSIFFIDFKLLHKELGIRNMINIEVNEEDKKRFEFNKPYSCIDLKWGKTTDVLPSLKWQGRRIIWLDYDQTLQPYMLEDIDIIFSNVEPGSFYMLSCNYSFHRYFSKEDNEYDLKKFSEDFEEYLPLGVKKEYLTKKESPLLIQKMIIKRIEYILNLRNASLIQNEKLIFHQMIFITYQDGAPMFTLGGYILSTEKFKIFKTLGVNKLPYISPSNSPLDLESPIVTSQELDLMNNFLPNKYGRFMKLKKIEFIPEEDRKRYLKNYRFYPNFVEIRN